MYIHARVNNACGCDMSFINNDITNKNGRCSVGTFINFVWATMGRKILSIHISAKEEDIEL